ncbi:MAG: S41 family peptidase, partial [Ferruginibacter sp.]
MEQNKIKTWLPVLLSLSMIAGIFFGYKMRDSVPGKSFFFMEKRRPVQEILDLVESRYVDEVNINDLSDTAIAAMLSHLDPHSSFIPAEKLANVNEDIQGSFYGIGIEFNIFKDTLHVINVLEDGPSFDAGLRTGDKILKAGDSVLSGKKVTQERIRNVLRGPLGSVINVQLLRGNKIVNLPITRGVIPLASLDAAYMMDSSIGYIRLNKFSTQTYKEFMTALLELKKQGLKKLILDLRGNGGGVLDEAVEIADEFIAGDRLITYTEGKHVKRKEYRCRREGRFETGELVVLADEGTASASEILMGALQDWDRATIIGKRSFGKGLVQEQYDLSDKSALRLTVARYYTPLGRSIQRSYAHGGTAYYDEIYARFDPGFQDSLVADSSKKFKTRGGKVLYGGGGIYPDVYISRDTARLSNTLSKLYGTGVLSDYGYRYIILHEDMVNKYKTPRSFVNAYTITDENWKLLQHLAAEDSVDISGISAKDKDYLKQVLKSSIARQV